MPLTMLQAVAAKTTKDLLKIKGFSEVKVEKVKEAVRKALVSAHVPNLIATCQY